ncbi:MAG TPA: hypothetical protein VFY84_17430 [Jiangellales bacterium]|nr:hypothetical protein [Jiangellales bacterium]
MRYALMIYAEPGYDEALSDADRQAGSVPRQVDHRRGNAYPRWEAAVHLHRVSDQRSTYGTKIPDPPRSRIPGHRPEQIRLARSGRQRLDPAAGSENWTRWSVYIAAAGLAIVLLAWMGADRVGQSLARRRRHAPRYSL